MTRFRALLIIAFTVALLALSSTPLTSCDAASALPLIHPPDTAPFPVTAAIPASRTAFVSIHFEDLTTSLLTQQHTESSYQGIRTMMHTLADPKRGATTRDRVVLVPMHTRAEIRDAFTSDGLIVLEMDERLPHKDICAPKFDRIYLWSRLLTKYDRIVYLDWDVIVERPMEHLFLCGEFCMVYNSILHFVDGIMILKPDTKVFQEMADAYLEERRILWPKMQTSSFTLMMSPSMTQCWERSYLFFLNWFGNIEAAPLFNARYGQSSLPLQRLDASIQLNAMLWYEKYSWTLFRNKEYRNMTNDQDIPALSVGFTTLKPFHWMPGLFFNLAWYWSDLRDSYLGVTHTKFVMTRVLLWLLLFLFATKGMKKLIFELYRRRPATGGGFVRKSIKFLRDCNLAVFGPVDGYRLNDENTDLVYVPVKKFVSITGYYLPMLGSDVVGIVCGGLQCSILAYLMIVYTYLIPFLTHPHYAWPLAFSFHILFIYMLNHWCYLSYHLATPLISAENVAEARKEVGVMGERRQVSLLPAIPSPTQVNYPFLSSISMLIFWEVTLAFFMRRTFYPEFVVKMFVMFPFFVAIMITTMNVSRAVWRSVEQTGRGVQMKEGGGSSLPLLPMQPTAHMS